MGNLFGSSKKPEQKKEDALSVRHANRQSPIANLNSPTTDRLTSLSLCVWVPLCLSQEKDKAVLELKRQRIRLAKYRENATRVMERETEIAKELLKRGEKRRALLALKKKRYQSTLIDKTEGQMMNIEQLCNSIEFAAVQSKVFDALKNGNAVLQSQSLSIHTHLSTLSAAATAYL